MVVDSMILVLVTVTSHQSIRYQKKYYNSKANPNFVFRLQIAISATTEHGNKPWYLEECSATLASAYSSGQLNSGERDIVCHFLLLLILLTV